MAAFPRSCFMLGVLVAAVACTDSTDPARVDAALRMRTAAGATTHPVGVVDTAISLGNGQVLTVAANGANTKVYATTAGTLADAFQSPQPAIQQSVQIMPTGTFGWIYGTVFSPNGSRLYVAGKRGNRMIGLTGEIDAIDTGATTASILVKLPGRVVSSPLVSRDGTRLYALSNKVLVFSLPTATVTDSVPLPSATGGIDMIFAANTDTLAYVLSEGASPAVWTINLKTHALVHTTALPPVSEYSPGRDLAVSLDGTQLYVLDGADDRVYAVAEPSGSLVSTLQLPTIPSSGGVNVVALALAVTPDGTQLWVANDTSLVVVDQASLGILKTIGGQTCGTRCGLVYPYDIAFTNNGKFAVLAAGSGDVIFMH